MSTVTEMRDYLVSFFNDFEYDSTDAAFLLFTYDRIAGREDTLAVWNEAIKTYEENCNCDFDMIISLAQEVAQRLDMHTYTAELLIFICLSKHLRELYLERNMDISIYHNSMLDLKYKLAECKAVKGVVGSFVAWWFGRFFNLERVALGRLQFEVDLFGRHYEKDGHILTPDSKAINIHIPRTMTHLTPEECDKAFAMAKEYFKNEVGEDCPFICHSWMLYPGNEAILPENTNVRRFMSRFDIFDHADDPTLEDLWRIFDTDERDFNRLPTDTTMRRAYVSHLKNGGMLGWGHGVFFL